MYGLGEFQLIREHRDDLLHEAEKRRLLREFWAASRKEPRHRGHIRALLRQLRRKPASLHAKQAR